MLTAPTDQKALGIFCTSNLPVWLDRNVYKNNLNLTNDPSGNKKAALDLPGLKDMTLKAVDILHERGGDKGFFLMSEAASVSALLVPPLPKLEPYLTSIRSTNKCTS